MVGYLLPGLAGAWPALRRPLGVEDRTASGRGYALTFDDGPHPQGTPAVLEILSRERVRATFFLVGEQVLRNPGARPRDRRRRPRHRPALPPPSQPAAPDAVAGARGHRAGARGHRRPTPAARRSCTARRTGCSTPPRCASRARSGWRTLLWSHWGRDWEARATPESIAARVTDGAGEGSVLLLHDADDYSAPGSWRRTAAALPRVLETLAERGLTAPSRSPLPGR